MRLGLAGFLAAMVLPLAACGGGSDSGGGGGGEWPGPPRPDDRGQLDVAAFNEYLAEHGEHARAPVIAATEFVRLDRATAGLTSVVARAPGEGAGPTTVTVTLDRLLDDSVRAQRFVLVLSPDGDGWQVDSAVVTQRCHQGRGHQAFTPEPCV